MQKFPNITNVKIKTHFEATTSDGLIAAQIIS